ncbi:MAG: hypothetical protein AAB214_08405 [Fibrobacterota bacterium]
MTPDQVLREVTRLLENAEIPYMVTGSFASSMLGMPRSTRDLDVVVAPESHQTPALIAAFDPEAWYIDPFVVREAVERKSMFNVVHLDSGWKVDVILRKDRPWSREEFSRRTPLLVGGTEIMFLRAEDSILSKLDWVRQGGSLRQLEDAGTVLDVQGDAIDFVYLEHWARELGLTDLLDKIRPTSSPTT